MEDQELAKYQRGKIYKIYSGETKDVYVGSTTEKILKERLSKHKASIKYNKRKNIKNGCTAALILKYDDANIELLENYPCNNREELLVRERYWAEKTPNCVNKRKASRKFKEYNSYYRSLHKEELDKNRTDYYYKNRESELSKRAVKVVCDICNEEFAKSYLTDHKKRRHSTVNQ